MASMEDLTVFIRVRVALSLWDAIKLRIAGVGAVEKVVEKLKALEDKEQGA
jgi:hypothetical protein